MSDDEEDYMSDKFLDGSGLQAGPSLIQDRAKKRQVEMSTKKAESIKRQRSERAGVNSNERLQESLKRPIDKGNIGFQMLAKMGYKPGQALGKDTTSEGSSAGSGPLVEPIGINIKTDRGGLGREAALLELAAKRRQLSEQRMRKQIGSAMTTEEFRKRSTQKAEERFMQGALRRCQLSCENLDIESKVMTPEMPWFWPERRTEAELDDDDEVEKPDSGCGINVECENDDEGELEEDDYTDTEKVEMVTNYLRTSYRFCFWCGVQFTDQADMDSNCPGLTRDDH